MSNKLEVHDHDNNRDSQITLEQRYEKLHKQCKKILSLLKSGVRLTVKDAILKHNIASLPRRLKDIRESDCYEGIKEEWVIDEKTNIRLYKVWYMDGTEEPAQEEKKKADPKPKKEKTVMPPNQNPLFDLM